MDAGLRVKGMRVEGARVWSWMKFPSPPSSCYFAMFLGKNLGKSELMEG